MQRRRAALGRKVHINSEEGLVHGSVDGAPLRDKGLAAGVPRRVCGVDAARVILERGALEDLVGVECAARVRLVELDDVGLVEVRDADVAARLASVLSVDGVDDDPIVYNTGLGLDGCRQGGEGEVGGDDTVVGSAVVVLDLLDEDEVGRLEVVHDVGGDGGEVGDGRREVLDVVVADGDAPAVAAADEGGGGRVVGGVLCDCDAGQGEDAVEAKGVCDDAGDLGELVAHLGLGVLCAVEGGANDDGLGVGVLFPVLVACMIQRREKDFTLVRHGETAVRIAAGDGPVANDPGVAVLVGARDADGALDGDELAAQ